MFKLFAYCLIIFASYSVQAQHQHSNNYGDATILKYESYNDGLGSYMFAFDTSDGTHRDEKGDLKDKGTEDEAMIVHGSYSFTGADGVVYTVKYTADENGFHPEGDHFTVPAFVPWLKGQPHDDGHYKHDHNVRINQVDTNFPSNADNREVNVRITPKYIPALKKRNLPANEAASHTDLTKKNIADVVAEINKLA